jgi:hypothetical protein
VADGRLMGDNYNVKLALTILCSLMFLGGQMAAMAMPIAGASQSAHHCGCGGKMPCCAAGPSSVPHMPVTATVSAGSQNLILSPVPAVVIWFLPTAAASSISPVITISPKAGDAPLFARHCAWLI